MKFIIFLAAVVKAVFFITLFAGGVTLTLEAAAAFTHYKGLSLEDSYGVKALSLMAYFITGLLSFIFYISMRDEYKRKKELELDMGYKNIYKKPKEKVPFLKIHSVRKARKALKYGGIGLGGFGWLFLGAYCDYVHEGLGVLFSIVPFILAAPVIGWFVEKGNIKDEQK